MVSISPVYEAVTWPGNEGILGVVGVAPWATIDFCHQLYALTKVEKEWEYPRVIIDNNSKIPSRGRHLQLGERDPSPWIHATIEELAAMGATVAVVPCNTAHILWSRWSKKTSIPLVNIIDVTVASIPAGTRCIAVLGSEMLCESGLYPQKLTNKSCEIVALCALSQRTIADCINAIKVARVLPEELATRLRDVVIRLKLQGVTTVVLACTELSLLKDSPVWQGLERVDSNEALARAALAAIAFKKMA